MGGAVGEARSEDAHSLLSPLHLPLDANAGDVPGRIVPAPGRLMATDRKSLVVDLLRISDLATVIVGAGAACASAYGITAFPGDCATFALLGAVLFVNYMQLTRSYRFESVRALPTQAGRILLNWSAVFATILAISSIPILNAAFPWGWCEDWFCLTFALLGATRLVSSRVIKGWQRTGRLSCRLAVVGHDNAVHELARRVGGLDEVELVTTLVLDRQDARTRGTKRVARVPKGLFEGAAPRTAPAGCTGDELLALARSRQIDEIVIAPGTAATPALRHLVRALRTLAIDVKAPTIGFDQPVSQTNVSLRLGMPLQAIVKRPLSCRAWLVKRTIDIVVSGILLLLLLPVLSLIALLIKLDSPGPVLFRQDRHGFNNDLIRIYKLRSMRCQPATEAIVVQARRNDPRVTRVGRFLRRTSLDELPQLYNVLKGDMSLVGPRPHPVALNEQFADLIEGYLARHRVKPGITGWAQVHGLRGETDTLEKMRRRIEHDLFYIENWSLLLDLRILCVTMFVGFANKNAY
jgi:Undecaprenyl-phosphate glucose phosphotransferase